MSSFFLSKIEIFRKPTFSKKVHFFENLRFWIPNKKILQRRIFLKLFFQTLFGQINTFRTLF